MKFFKSIRWQLQMWHGLLLLAVICAFGVTAYQLEKTEQIRDIDSGLQERLSLLVNTLRSSPRNESRAKQRDPQEANAPFEEKQLATLLSSSSLNGMFGPESGYYFAVWMRGPKPLARSANAPQDVPKPERGSASARVRVGECRESFIFAAPVDCVLVGRSMTAINAALYRRAILMITAGAVILILGLAGGWWLTNRALRPVREISATAAHIAGGDLSQRINVTETESELGELAGVLNATFSRLDAAFAQQARFTSDAAHELRTPLSVLLTQTQSALSRERTAGEYRDALAANESAAQRMKRLIESLLELARFDAGQEPLHRKPCDLAAIAGDCAEMLLPLAEARGIKVELDLQEARCEADPERMAQVVTNLLKNAIDFNRDGGSISVRTILRGDFAAFEVVDTGCGIPAEHLSRVFDRFYKVDESRAGSGSRTGLGLAISKAIIDMHGGSIEALSNEKEGATFRLSLPAMKA